MQTNISGAIGGHQRGSMLSLNDYVFYSTIGICQIADIRIVELGGPGKQECYVLKPLANPKSTIYLPASQTTLNTIRPVLSKKDIYSLIRDMPKEKSMWIDDARKRNKEYLAIIKTCDSRKLVGLIKTLQLEKSRDNKKGKGLNSTDSKIMVAAEKLLYEEFAFVLGIALNEVVPFIQKRISR
jgi:CarD family transcriptional regulator